MCTRSINSSATFCIIVGGVHNAAVDFKVVLINGVSASNVMACAGRGKHGSQY